MNIRAAWDALRGREPKASPGFRRGGWTQTYPGQGLVYAAPQAKKDYARLAGHIPHNSLVATCLKWLSNQAALATLKVGKRVDGEYEAVDAHDLYQIQRRPNPWQSWSDVLGLIVHGLGAQANAYGYKGRDRDGAGRWRQLYVLPNHRVEVKSDGDIPWGYEYTDRDGRKEVYPPDRIIHFRMGVDPLNPAMGWSAMGAQTRNVAAVNSGERYTVGVLENAHAGKLIVPRDSTLNVDLAGAGDMDEVERNATKRRLRYNLAGEQAGSIEVGMAPMDVLDLGLGPEEMAIDSVLNWPIGSILAALGLNALALNLPMADAISTFANKAEARKEAWEYGVLPLLNCVAYAFQSQGLFSIRDDVPQPEFGDAEDTEVWFETADVPAMQEDADTRATRASTLFTGKLYPRGLSLAAGGFDPTGTPDDDRYYDEPTEAQEERDDAAMEKAAELQMRQAEAEAEPGAAGDEPEDEATDGPPQ